MSLFNFLNVGLWVPTAKVARTGEVLPLAVAPDARIAETRIKGEGATLGAFLASPASRAQGMIVGHGGKIVF